MTSTIVLITGANAGVGYAATKAIASGSEKYHVIMACRSDAKARAAMEEIKAAGIKGQISTSHLDVTDEKAIEAAVAQVEKDFGRLDVLVNNAATYNMNPNTKIRYDETFAANVTGPAVVSALFRPLLFKSAKPYSVYISSGLGSMGLSADKTQPSYYPHPGLPNCETYRASKAALNQIALQESILYRETPLKVFAMCPGFVVSNLRGTSEEARSGWGMAGDPDVSGRTLLSIIEGKRDADAGNFVHKGGVYPW